MVEFLAAIGGLIVVLTILFGFFAAFVWVMQKVIR